jgi:hypothetical protein
LSLSLLLFGFNSGMMRVLLNERTQSKFNAFGMSFKLSLSLSFSLHCEWYWHPHLVCEEEKEDQN